MMTAVEVLPVPPGRKYSGPIDEKTIGRRMRDARTRRGMTQVELAQKLGIDQSLISEYERGIVRLHGGLLVGIAKILKTSADELLGLEKPRDSGASTDRRLVRRLQTIDKLPKRDKQALIRNIDNVLRGAGVA
jgi:transcriptional regulator with XRE-family HTH domain